MGKRSRIAIVVGVGLTGLVLSAVFLFHADPVAETLEFITSPADTAVTVAAPSAAACGLPDFPPRRKQTAWTAMPSDPFRATEQWSNVPDHAVFVRLDGQYEQWLLGSPVDIYIPHLDKTLTAVVDRIRPNGVKSMTIHAVPAENEQILKKLVLTFSEVQTLAHVTTNQGSWEMNGDHEIGWIVATADLHKSRDFSETDVKMHDYDRYANAEYVPKRTD